jgi:hypothetical protein
MVLGLCAVGRIVSADGPLAADFRVHQPDGSAPTAGEPLTQATERLRTVALGRGSAIHSAAVHGSDRVCPCTRWACLGNSENLGPPRGLEQLNWAPNDTPQIETQ